MLGMKKETGTRHTHSLIQIKQDNAGYEERRVPDRSRDLFLFWGSLGFFTGGLRLVGFSRSLGLSLSVPETRKHRKTHIYS